MPSKKIRDATRQLQGGTATPATITGTTAQGTTTARRGGKAKVTSVTLANDVREALDEYAWKNRTTRSKVVEDALRKHLGHKGTQ